MSSHTEVGRPGVTARHAVAPRPDSTITPGSMVGEYEIERELASGGMGIVYAARHPIIGKRVAIKVLRPEMASLADVIERFIAEASAVNHINHPNIVDVFGFGRHHDGRHFCVMEYLSGESLAARLERDNKLPMQEALPILRQVANALDAAHQEGVVHRDLKPDNVFLAGTDPVVAKVLDFGIAKLLEQPGPQTQPGAIVGTPVCMSPEQCRGGDVDHRADVYAFGALAYRVLVGRYPFEGNSLPALMYAHLSVEPPPPSSHGAPAAWDAPLLRALAKRPDDRQDCIGEVIDELMRSIKRPTAPVPAIRRVSSSVSRQLPAEEVFEDTLISSPDYGHSRKVRCVAFSPDGKLLASDGVDSAVQLWRVDGTELGRLAGNGEPVTHVAFSPDGTMVASASSDRTVRVWKTTGELLYLFQGHKKNLSVVRFSRVGQRLLTGGLDGSVRVWELGSGRCHVYKGHNGPVRWVTDSPTMSRVASVGDDKTVRIWDDEEGMRWMFREHRKATRYVTFSPDGNHVAAAGFWPEIFEWDLTKTFEQAKAMVIRYAGHQGGVGHLAYSPDGKRLASGGADGVISLWTRGSRNSVNLSGHNRRVTRVAFSPNGRFLASASIDSSVRLWDLRRRRCVDVIELERPAPWISFTPDGNYLTSCSSPWSVVQTPLPDAPMTVPVRQVVVPVPPPQRSKLLPVVFGVVLALAIGAAAWIASGGDLSALHW